MMTTDHPATRRRRHGCVVALVALTLGAASCGSDDDDDKAADTTAASTTVAATAAPTTAVPTTAAPTTAAPTTAAPTSAAETTDATIDATTDATTAPTEGDSPGGAIAVAAEDYSYSGLPKQLAAGSMLTLTNNSTKEVHELVAVRIPDSESRSVADLLALPEDQLEAIFGDAPPAAVLVAPPGSPAFPAVGDGTITEPGRYVMLCTIPVGADPEAFLAAAQSSGDEPPAVEGAPPHFTVGMYQEVTVG